MFKRFFGNEKAAKEAITARIYDRIVAAARQPVLYADWGVPDTPLGRYEMVSLHLFLVLHRLRGEEGARDIAQGLTDTFFAELDHSIRELGVGDLSVPKRMKKLARMFYGRLAAYGEAVEQADADLLAAALARNVRPDDASWLQARRLASYVLAAHRQLTGQRLPDLLAGNVVMPAAAAVEPEKLS
jgi:cytochrome b pre-mRNA-processing protein 3